MTDPILFHPAVRRSEVFAGLSAVDLQILVPLLKRRHLKAKEALFREGEWGDYLALLVDGHLQVHTVPDKAVVPIGTIEPGQVVGEMACIDPSPRSANVHALEDSLVLLLDRTLLVALRENAPTLAVAITSGLVRRVTTRLRATNQRLLREFGMEAAPQAHPAPQFTPLPFQGMLLAADVPASAGFSEEDAQRLLVVARPVTFPPHAVLYEEGRPGAACHLILRGRVQVLRHATDGPHEIATLDPGAMVGQVALVDWGPRSATVKAVETVVALELDREMYETLLVHPTPFAVRLQERIAVAGIRQLRLADTRLAPLLSKRGVVVKIKLGGGDTPIGRMAITRAIVATQEWTLEIDDPEDG